MYISIVRVAVSLKVYTGVISLSHFTITCMTKCLKNRSIV